MRSTSIMFELTRFLCVPENNNFHGIEKATFSVLWERLSEQLNDIGPPKHSAKKWKRVWSVYKYNNKSRLSEILDKENKTNEGNIFMLYWTKLNLCYI